MKKRDLERKLRNHGWHFLRHGGSHDIWTNGADEVSVPRHKEIGEMLAKGVLKEAKMNPGKTH
jgi:mRNA interferase HicA